MKILCIIPARGGSKGIPRKNIKLLGDQPLLKYTTDVALESKLIQKVIVSTDDNEIMECALKLGVEVPFIRPDHLGLDSTPTLPVIQHALNFFKSKGENFDAVCLLQATSPFRTVGFLDEAIQTFIEKETDSLVSVQEVPHEYNPHWVFEDNNGLLNISTGEKSIIPRRQELPMAYHRDGSIYLTKVSVIQKDNSLYGRSISYVVSSKNDYVNIDTQEDWLKAEELLKSRKTK